MTALPVIPESAPFTAAQRLWLNGYLAGWLSNSTDQPAISSRPRLRIPVLYASQTGNSAALAADFAAQLTAAGFDSPCHGTEESSALSLSAEKYLLLVSSTWGDGDPPDNAVDFWSGLRSDDHPRLDHLSYAVLALGDTNYLNFCAQGKAFDARLAALGAKPLVPRADCDSDFEESAAAWFREVLGKLGSLTPDAGSAETAAAKPKPASGYHKKNPFPARLISNQRLNAADSVRDTRHFEFDLSGAGLDYEVGDVLGVYPKNNPSLVAEMITALGFPADATVPIPGGGESSLSDALLRYYDITSLNHKTLTDWASLAGSPFLNELLSADDPAELESFLHGRERIDLVLYYPAPFAQPADFVALLRPLAPRLYSISSSPRAHPGEVHLTVAKVTYESHGRLREGVCSTCLSDRVAEGETVPIFFQSASHFKLPVDPSKDVIMCGPGTGIAPFRAFLEEREATRAPGRNWLFFGNPHEATDFLYREQLTGLKERGVLTRFDPAWSRDGESKVYVQNKMAAAGAELWQWLSAGAHFYVCGDAKHMAKDVDHVLHSIVAIHGGLGEVGAIEFIKNLSREKRYQRDVY
jgi:sulfite reductase (NADPH) flavoprotein alpha-component